jgi:membrane complex biogenesis BtpA family protein
MSRKLIGMLHLPPLPGSPRSASSLDAIEAQAISEARVLAGEGFDAAILENFGDAPFFKDSVEAVTVAAMSRIASAVRRETPSLVLGVNVLRNDARSALAVAAASGAGFIRVNVHVGATVTDQGLVEGRAAETLRLRAALGVPVAVWADVHVKHGRPLSHETIEAEAEDAVERGLAEALIVSGAGTGKAASLADIGKLRELELGVPLYVGSGVDRERVLEFLDLADGVIVGTALKRDGVTTAALDPERVKRFAAAVKAR